LAYITFLLLFQTEYGNSRCNRVCHMLGAEHTASFIIKCLLKQAPFIYTTACFVMGILLSGYILMISETPLDRVHSNYSPYSFFNSCWAAICTMTTVGYGDIVPRTLLGRSTAFFSAVYGMGIISLLVVSFNQFLQMDSAEGTAFTIIKRLKVRDMMKEVAGRLLVTINKKGNKNDLDSEFSRYSKIKQLIGNFRALRRAYRNISDNSLHETMERNFNKLVGHVTD
jgi:hypothetical protein